MRKIICYLLSVISLLFLSAPFAFAENETKLTITPPLIKNNMNPGDSWASSIKVVNNGAEPVTVYTQVMDFKSRDDGTAGPEFIQKKENLAEEYKHYLLSQWLEAEAGPIEIPAQQNREIPFAITLPETAEPGGHYAAVLIGNRPDEDVSGTAIKVSSLMASLIMINIKGDTRESGEIREFSVPRSVYSMPEINFTVKFENNGNIHIQPQGEINILDMFGKEKGKIEINHASDFGNVLPSSMRKWEFNWKGENKIWNMGRYRANLVMSYGNEAKETVDRSLYFWVLDFKIIGIVVFSILAIILIIRWLIRRSIKKAIRESAAEILPLEVEPEETAVAEPKKFVAEKTETGKAAGGKTIDLRKIK